MSVAPLVRAGVVRERVQVPVWVLVGGLLALATASAVPQAFGDEQQRRTLIELVTATPSLLAIRGVPDGTGEGAYTYFEIFSYLGLVAGLMSVFLVTRHTRADEEQGRDELVLAAPVARTTPLVTAVGLAVGADLLLGVLVAAGFTAGGLPADGSWLAGAATATVGIAFTGTSAVAAQLAPTSRSANGIGVAVVLAAFALRAAGDALGTRTADGLSVVSAWPSALSPIGWGQHVFPYTRQDAWPLLWCVLLGAVTVGAAVATRARRDLGASAFRAGTGPATGRIRSAFGLAWRLHRGTVLAWAVGGAVLGSFAGGLGSLATDALGDDPAVSRLLASFVPGGRGALLDEFVAAVVGIAGVLAAAAGIAALTRAADDDRTGRSELLLGTPVGRVQRLAGWMTIAVVSVLVVTVATGLVTGVLAAAAGDGTDSGTGGTGGSDRFWSSLGAGLAQIPAALLLVAVAALLTAWSPVLAARVAWPLLAAAVALGQFGGLLQIPRWLRDVSPFTHTPGVPAAHVDWSGAWWMSAVAVGVGIVALVLARRQEVRP